MARVECTVTETMLANNEGREQPGIVVECGRCDHKTESFGTSDRSVKRCLVMLKEECPLGERNFYVTDGD